MVSLPDSEVYVIAGHDLQQKDLHGIIKGKWPSDVCIHAAGILLKRKYFGFPHQIDIHCCKASVACESTIEIYHDGVNYWLVSANIWRVVNVYNSLYQGSHNENIKSLLSLFY